MQDGEGKLAAALTDPNISLGASLGPRFPGNPWARRWNLHTRAGELPRQPLGAPQGRSPLGTCRCLVASPLNPHTCTDGRLPPPVPVENGDDVRMAWLLPKRRYNALNTCPLGVVPPSVSRKGTACPLPELPLTLPPCHQTHHTCFVKPPGWWL